jgi:acyl carrier protein
VEDQFHCSIPNQDVRDLQTVGDLIAYLRAHRSRAEARGA